MEPVLTMRIRFADISQMLRVADPRSGARLCEAQHVQSMRMPINRIGMVLTRKQVAELLQGSVRTIENWISNGYLPHYRIGWNVRFRMSEIQACWEEKLKVRRRS